MLKRIGIFFAAVLFVTVGLFLYIKNNLRKVAPAQSMNNTYHADSAIHAPSSKHDNAGLDTTHTAAASPLNTNDSDLYQPDEASASGL